MNGIFAENLILVEEHDDNKRRHAASIEHANDNVSSTAVANVDSYTKTVPVSWHVKYAISGESIVANVVYVSNSMVTKKTAKLRLEDERTICFTFNREEVFDLVNKEVIKNTGEGVKDSYSLVYAHKVAAANRDFIKRMIDEELQNLFKTFNDKEKYERTLELFPRYKKYLRRLAKFDAFLKYMATFDSSKEAIWQMTVS